MHTVIVNLCLLFLLLVQGITAEVNPFMHFVGKPYASYHYAIRDSLRLRYATHDTKYADRTVKQLRDLPDRFHDKQWKLEADFFEANFYHDNMGTIPDSLFADRMQDMLAVSRAAHNQIFEVRILRRLLDFYNWNDIVNSLYYSGQLERAMRGLTPKQYPDVLDCKLRVGEIYYTFKDFPMAEKCFKEIVNGPVFQENQRIFVIARNDLGLVEREYYHRYDESDKCFQSILDLNNQYGIIEKPIEWIAIVKGNLGINQYLRKNYEKAAELMEASLKMTYSYDDLKFAYGIACQLSSCYSDMNRYEDAWRCIQIARDFFPKISSFTETNRQKEFVALNKYYAGTGRTDLAKLCIDSAFIARDAIEMRYSIGQMLNVEKQIDQYDIRQSKEESRYNYNRFIFFSVLATASFLFLVVVFILYVQKRRAFRALVLRNQQWAAEEKPYPTPKQTAAPPTENKAAIDTDADLFEQICQHIETTACYKNPSFTLDQLSKEIGLNRTYVSNAINEHEDGFNSFINKYRVHAAITMLSENADISIETLSVSVGFNTRQTLFHAFKAITGLTPSQFKQNMSSKFH